tara:strand:- start:480 stop:692 length:213 start_codon:yes stop_codon:yes gene_type:complete
MGNMSYCRFENTARDLRDCLNAIHNGEIEDLSSYEIDGLISILRMSKDIASMEDDINDHLQASTEYKDAE